TGRCRSVGRRSEFHICRRPAQEHLIRPTDADCTSSSRGVVGTAPFRTKASTVFLTGPRPGRCSRDAPESMLYARSAGKYREEDRGKEDAVTGSEAPGAAGGVGPGGGVAVETTTADVATVDFFTDPSLMADAYGYYEAVRAKGPVWQEPNHGAYLITGYD